MTFYTKLQKPRNLFAETIMYMKNYAYGMQPKKSLILRKIIMTILTPFFLAATVVYDTLNIAYRLGVIAVNLVRDLGQLVVSAAKKAGQGIGAVCSKGKEFASLFFKKAIKAPFTALWNKLFKAKAAGSEADSQAHSNNTPPSKEAPVLKEQTREKTSQNDVNDNSAEPNSSAEKKRWCSIL